MASSPFVQVTKKKLGSYYTMMNRDCALCPQYIFFSSDITKREREREREEKCIIKIKQTYETWREKRSSSYFDRQ